MRFTIIAILFGLISSSNGFSQEPEWLFKIPKYYRLKGGSSVFVVDKQRGGVLFDGGAYDTYITYDGGETWKTIFDIKMFYLDVATSWQMDDVGRWYYTGNVYGKMPINLVSEDAGETMRYTIADTNALPFMGRWEDQPTVVLPDALMIDASQPRYPRPGTPRGRYTSCDAGRTWTFHGSSRYLSQMDGRTVGAGRFVMSDSTFKAKEIIACSDSVVQTSISTSNPYVRLKDGTVLQYVPNIFGFVRGFHITRPDSSTETIYDPPFTIEYGGLINDTAALYFGSRGQILLYGMVGGFRLIDDPPVYNRFQRVGNAGIYGDRVLMQTIIPNGNLRDGTRWTVYNVRSGEASTFLRPPSYGTSWGIYFRSNPFDVHGVVAFSDSTWLASFLNGELLRTDNAGATWTIVDNIQRDEKWGESWIGINRLFMRGNGQMALINERNRLMVSEPTTDTWRIIHPAPFIHEIDLGNNSISIFTRSRITYDEDNGGRYRAAFGPSSIYFAHPDTMWISGDVVGRFTADGRFIDTLLARRSRLIKRISPLVTISAMDSLYFTFNNGKDWVYVGYSLPKYIYNSDTLTAGVGDVAVAKDGSIIVGLRGLRTYHADGSLIDTVPGGIMRSTNNGDSWERCTSDIPEWLHITSVMTSPSGTIFCLASELNLDARAVNPFTGEIELLDHSAYGEKAFKLGFSYIYRSTDNGLTWSRTFVFPDRFVLPSTDMRFTMMPDGRILAIHPTAGIAISHNDGLSWGLADPLNIGDQIVNDVVFTDDGYAHIATNDGYVRILIENILSVRESHHVSGSLRVLTNDDGSVTFLNEIPSSVSVYSIDGRLIQRFDDPNGIQSFQRNNDGHRAVVIVATVKGKTLSTIIMTK